MAKQKKQAVGYCRVSSKGQERDGTGLDRQEKSIKVYAKQSGYKLVKIYNEAFAGTETDRPAFETMLADLLDNHCRIIIVECLDRLARDLNVQLQIIALLAGKGITLLNAMTGQDCTNPKDDMTRTMVQMQGAFAELEKRLLVRKLKKGRDAKREKTGRCEGRKPYGYYPGEDKIIQRIKQLYRKPHKEKRMGFQTIAKKLNAEGISTRSGVAWSDMQIRSILLRKKVKD